MDRRENVIEELRALIAKQAAQLAQQAARIAAHPDLSIVCMAGSHHLHMEAGAAHVARLIDDFLLEGRVSSR